MFRLLAIFQNVFKYIIAISAVCMCFIEGYKRVRNSKSKKKHKEEKKGEKRSFNDRLNYIYNFVILLVIILSVILILLYNKELVWIIIVISIPGYLKYFSELLPSFDVVIKTAKDNDKKKMSPNEKVSLITVAFFWYVINIFRVSDVAVFLASSTKYVWLNDLMVGIFFVLILYIYFFISISLMPPIITGVLMLLKGIYSIIPGKKKMVKLRDCCANRIERPVRHTSLLEKFWNLKKSWFWAFKVIGILILGTLSIIADLLWTAILMILQFLNDATGHLLSILTFVKRKVAALCRLGMNISDERVVGISFRLSIILSLSIMVIINRYQLVFTCKEESTEVLEFIASTVIIPVVFECIFSLKKRNEKIISD